MVCTHCGQPINPGDKICRGCSRPVSGVSEMQETMSPLEAETNTDQPSHPQAPVTPEPLQQNNIPDSNKPQDNMPENSGSQAYGNAYQGIQQAGQGATTQNGNTPQDNIPQSYGSAPYGNIPQGSPLAGHGPTTPYGEFQKAPAYSVGAQPYQVKPKKKIPKWVPILIVCAVVLIGAGIGIVAYTRYVAVQSAITEMQDAVLEAEALSKDVDALYISQDSDFIRSDLTQEEIADLQTRLNDIQMAPEEAYTEEVSEQVNLSDHKKLISQMGERLDEAEEKRVARADVNVIFEVDAVSEEAYNSDIDLPLAPETDTAVIEALREKYIDYDANDLFWEQIWYVLTDAEYELVWIENARVAVEELEAMESISESDYELAQSEIDNLYDGTVKETYQARLDALEDRIANDTNTIGNYATLDAYMAANPDVFNMEDHMEVWDKKVEGMGEAFYFTKGNTLVIQIRYYQAYDSTLDSVDFDEMFEGLNNPYIALASVYRIYIPDAAVRLEMCKSDGEVVWSKSY